MSEAEHAARARRFTCDQCGAEQKFDAASGKLKCAHCGAMRDVPHGEGTVAERDLFQGLEQATRGLGTGAETRVSECEECGAKVVFADGATATRCTFCGSSKVLEQAENRQALRPESLLPFGVDQARANQAFTGWLGKLWFRPSDLKRLATVQQVTGVYVPFWTYDARVDSRWRADAGYHYYEEEVYTTQENGQEVTRERRVQRTRWEAAWGERVDEYDDMLVCASVGLPRELAGRFSSFDTARLVPYAPGYLAGWRAEEYAVDLAQGFDEARRKMEAESRNRCARDVPGDTQRNLVAEHAFSNVTFKHVLLPVWIAAYRYRGAVYRFLVNGQTGEVVGKAPWSWGKIAAFVLTLVALAVALYYIFGRSS